MKTSSYHIAIDGIMLMFGGIGFVTLPIVVWLYIRINTQRAKIMNDGPNGEWRRRYTDKELRAMGDRAVDFRYML